MPDALGILTKAEAFAPIEGERRIAIDFSAHDFRFTNRWFDNRNLVTFSTFLPQKVPSTESVFMLQIGVWEARDVVWQFQNTLKHERSFLVVIDPWTADANPKMTARQMEQIEANARHNLSPWADKVRIIKDLSQNVMGNPQYVRSLFPGMGFLDLIVLDGDHNEEPVYRDAVNSLALLRRGGWLLFDDVRQRRPKRHHVMHGLRRFLMEYGGKVKQIWSHRFCECYEKL